MVNKKGWVRIIESTICALLIIAVVLLYAQDNKSYFNIEDYADVESAINELVMDEAIRTSILEMDGSGTNEQINLIIAERIKRSGIRVNNTVCDFDEIYSPVCTLTKPDKIENIHAYERLISTSLEKDYNLGKTKVLRIIVYEDRR